MRIIPMLIIGLMLTGCSSTTERIENIEGELHLIKVDLAELDSPRADLTDYLAAQEGDIKARLRLNDYEWEESGVRFTTGILDVCLSTYEIWQATPIPPI